MRRILILTLCLVDAVSLMAKKPRVTPYLADSAANTGMAIVVCPGGSYSWLDMKT